MTNVPQEVDRLETAQLDVNERLSRLEAAIHELSEMTRTAVERPSLDIAAIAARVDDMSREIGRLSRFVLKTADDRAPAPPAPADAPPQLQSVLPMDVQFERLEAMAPRTFRLWKGLLEHNRQSYSGFPVHSCSVHGHPSAAMFTCFLNQFLRGDVLDIGCGPQPVPLYLQQYPADRVCAVDPISTPEQHPFHFFQGVAEFLPWRARSFDIVIAATSLDHVLFLDKALREIHRVLKDDGEFLIWVAFVAGSAPYDPTAPDIEPVDEFHLFHFTEHFFEGALSGLFAIRDKLRVNLEIDHHFYRLGKVPSDVEEEADP